MEIITLARRAAPGRLRSTVRSSMPHGNFAEIFAYGDASVHPISDLASAVCKIRSFHPGGADLILIGMSTVPGMKIIRDSWGFINVLIGLRRVTLEAGDDVLVAFDHGALRPAGVIGFLWEGGDAPDSRPPESDSTLIKSRLDDIRHLRRLNLP